MPDVCRSDLVECKHCGEKMNVTPNRQPVAYMEREAEGERLFSHHRRRQLVASVSSHGNDDLRGRDSGAVAARSTST